MKNYLLTSILLIHLISNISSQSLSRVYDLINGNEFGTEILVGDEGYFVLTKGICYLDSGDSKRCRSMLSLTSNGYVRNRQLFVNRLSFSEPSPLQLINDTIYIFGFNDFKVPWDWIIYKTNMNGDSLGKLIYNDFPEPKVVGRGLSSNDEYLYLIGNTYDTGWSTKSQIMVVKMDKQGNIIKEERFLNVTESLYDYEMHDIVKLDDGTFVLLYTYIFESGRIPGIIKFDENLNYIWYREFNHNRFYDYFPGITALDDGGILFNWEIYVPDEIDNWKDKYGKYGTTPKTFTKIDKHGNTVWSDTMWTLIPVSYNPAPKGIVYKMEQTKDGDIIGAGIYKRYESLPINNWAWIFKYSKDGELLWEKIYEDQNIDEAYSKFYDIMEAPNGNIVCTGVIMDADVSSPPDYTWVLRVDSDGCFEPGCGVADSVQLVYTKLDSIRTIATTTDEIMIVEDNKNEISIYPNPAIDKINIMIGKGYKFHTCRIGVKWSIYDIIGRKVKTGSIDNFYDFSISGLSGLQSGVYFLKIEDKNRMVSFGKFVVE